MILIDPLLPLLLSVVQIPKSNGTERQSTMMARTLSESDDDFDLMQLNAYFVPTATENFTLTFTRDTTARRHERRSV